MLVHSNPILQKVCSVLLVLALLTFIVSTANAAASTCFGTPANGRLEQGVKLPNEGKNFSTYSSLGASLGRTYVHSKVADIVLAAYAALEESAPRKIYVVGETGWASGGRIRPHRTHRNGLSVDFMVPVLDTAGRSVPLPTHMGNKYGYNIEFDNQARYENYRIDFEAIAEHLYQLKLAAQARGAGLALVIFDPPFLSNLLATKRGAYLKADIVFMKRNAWVRHDEHYHVDFAVPCLPMQ